MHTHITLHRPQPRPQQNGPRPRGELGVNDSDHAPVLLDYLQIRVPKGAVRVRPAPRRIAATRRIARRVDVHFN